MNYHTISRIIAGITAALSLAAAFSCSDNKPAPSDPAETTSAAEPTTASGPKQATDALPDLSGQTINWLADYDLNPPAGQDRSVALALFEDVCGAKVNFIPCGIQDKFTKLAALRTSGENVDMFPYDSGVQPYGVSRDLFAPLDPFFEEIGVDTTLWSGMEDVIDNLEYNGQHYVLPYSISDPTILVYSRKLVNESGLGDPYDMWQNNSWDWDMLTELMDTFVKGAEPGKPRYGISGWFSKAALCSAGEPVVKYTDGQFTNNLHHPLIGGSENIIRYIRDQNLCRPGWNNLSYSPEMDTLFFAGSGAWALSESIAACPDADLMVVPFPHAHGAPFYHSDAELNAKMLVNGSDKGEAVAAYIRCERLAAEKAEYKQIARDAALAPKDGANAAMTEEQYDALQACLDPKQVIPMYDFAYGMGTEMYGNGDYSYDKKGVMTNLEEAMINRDITAWEELREKCSPIIDKAIERYNK